jgi:hypothetical protein
MWPPNYVGKFRKHLATHDPIKKYRCERCGHEDNRSDNFAKHDDSCRKKRMPPDLSDSLDDHERASRLPKGVQRQTNMVFPDIQQPIHFNDMGFGDGWPTSLHQSPNSFQSVNFNSDLWPPSMDVTSCSAWTQTLDISQLAPSPEQSDSVTYAFDQEPTAAFKYKSAPETCDLTSLDQFSILKSPFSYDPNQRDFNQSIANLEVLSSSTSFGLNTGNVCTMTLQAVANTMMYDPYVNMQLPSASGQPLNTLLQWPELDLNSSGQNAHLFAQEGLNSMPTTLAPLLLFAGQPAYESSLQSSLRGNTKQKFPSYPSDDGSDHAKRIRTGYGNQGMWMNSYGS